MTPFFERFERYSVKKRVILYKGLSWKQTVGILHIFTFPPLWISSTVHLSCTEIVRISVHDKFNEFLELFSCEWTPQQRNFCPVLQSTIQRHFVGFHVLKTCLKIVECYQEMSPNLTSSSRTGLSETRHQLWRGWWRCAWKWNNRRCFTTRRGF